MLYFLCVIWLQRVQENLLSSVLAAYVATTSGKNRCEPYNLKPFLTERQAYAYPRSAVFS